MLSICSLLSIYIGIKYVQITAIYLGAFLLGVGSALTFLPTIGYLKFFPSKYVSLYVAGLAFAGFFLSSFYLFALYYGFKFIDVRFLINVYLFIYLCKYSC